MMGLVFGLVLVVALYARTFRYWHLIDDNVKMSGYLYDVPRSLPPPSFLTERHAYWARCLAIGCHMMNVWLVYLLLGWKASLLFAVYPISVGNVAWMTGSYYSCTTLLTLISYYFITNTPWWVGLVMGAFAYGVALNTTVATISYPFVFLFSNPLGLVTLIPLGGFLFGKRFTTGKKIREEKLACSKIAPDVFTVGRIALMVKTVALYVYTAMVPLKLCFFRTFASRYRIIPELRKELDSFNLNFFAALSVIGVFLLLGFVVGKLFWTLWFLVLISAFSQYKMLGQAFAERYMYPAVVGLCAILAQLPEPAFWFLVGAYLIRAHMYVPVFASNQALYENGVKMEPDEPANYCNLSDWFLMVQPDYSLAGHYIQKNIALDPIDCKPHLNFASLWRRMKNPVMAMKHIKIAKERAEGYCSPWIHEIIDQQTKWIGLELEGKSAAISPAEYERLRGQKK